MSRANLSQVENRRRNNESARIRRKNKLMLRTPMHYSIRAAKRQQTNYDKWFALLPWWSKTIKRATAFLQRMYRKVFRRPQHFNMSLSQLNALRNVR